MAPLIEPHQSKKVVWYPCWYHFKIKQSSSTLGGISQEVCTWKQGIEGLGITQLVICLFGQLQNLKAKMLTLFNCEKIIN